VATIDLCMNFLGLLIYPGAKVCNVFLQLVISFNCLTLFYFSVSSKLRLEMRDAMYLSTHLLSLLMHFLIWRYHKTKDVYKGGYFLRGESGPATTFA
jgi:hypothetical protein